MGFVERARIAPQLPQAVEEVLVSGGDSRLAIAPETGRNFYGAAPAPCPGQIDFASSTASTISPTGFARAKISYAHLQRLAAPAGLGRAFDHLAEQSRRELIHQLGANGAEAIFAASGTDTQLIALSIARALITGPIVNIILGEDQTGSGTGFTARGQHFSESTALGKTVAKGQPIAELAASVSTHAIAFHAEDGRPRGTAELEGLVLDVMEKAIGQGAKVVLQAMDASKLGWRAPSLKFIDALMARWPNDILVIADACQTRLSRARLNGFLDRGCLVLVTGSKFFTGPPFTGAVLVPTKLGARLEQEKIAAGLAAYSSRYDWPQKWAAIREALSDDVNLGQWLRWEATLAEMARYHALPQIVREALLAEFAAAARARITASSCLTLLSRPDAHLHHGDGEFESETIFAFQPHQGGVPLTIKQCGMLYRALRNDRFGPPCFIGQPVAFRHSDCAALRINASARLVSDSSDHGFVQVLENLRLTIRKIEALVPIIDTLEPGA